MSLTSNTGTGLDTLPAPPSRQQRQRPVAAFLTGYLIEESLSVDNLFVISMVFGYFKVPAKYQHRVLFWGIIGAQVMRGAMIGMGAALISHFEWILYAFGAFLLYTAWKMLYAQNRPSPGDNYILKWARRALPITKELHGPHFFVSTMVETPDSAGVPGSEQTSQRREPESASPALVAVATAPAVRRRWMLTPLALALLMVETTDLLFAVDSIPATFAVTTDPFLVFTSNIFAVLGLRAMYFALAGVLQKFKYLSVSLAVILAVVGLKMLAKHFLKSIHHQSYWTLGLVILCLGIGVLASIIAARKTLAPPCSS